VLVLAQDTVAVVGMQQRLLELLALRDLDEVAVAVSGLIVLADDLVGLVEEPANAPVLRGHPVLRAERLARLLRPYLLGDHPLAVVGMDHLAEEVRICGPFLGRVAEDRLELRAHVDVRAGLVGPIYVDGQRALIYEGPKPLIQQLPVGVGHRTLPGGCDERSGWWTSFQARA
jgi:hypothetical protein